MQEQKGKTLLAVLAIVSACLLYVRFGNGFQADPYEGFNRVYQGNTVPVTLNTTCAIPPEITSVDADMMMINKEGEVIRSITQQVTAKELANHTFSFLVPRSTEPGGYAIAMKIHNGKSIFTNETTKPFLVVNRYFPSLHGAYYPLALLIGIVILLGSFVVVVKKQKMEAGENDDEITATPSDIFPPKKPQRFVMR